MKRLAFAVALFAAAALHAQDLRRSGGDWVQYPTKGCIGGSRCPEKSLRVALEDRPVLAVRFEANDAIGETAGGALRVRIDGNTVRDYLDIARRGETYTLDVDEMYGRSLIFEPARNDEVEVSHVAVLYGHASSRIPRRPGGGAAGWRSYPRSGMCIGGDQCRKNGTRITIALEDAPVIGVRFWAQDGIGERADGKLTVRIDDHTIASYIDVQRAGKRHELDVDNVVGSKLVIATASDDEVEVKDIEVLYGRAHDRYPGPGYDESEVRNEGGCIGGDQCGGSRARIRIPIHGRAVASVRFYARDDVGTRAGGELRIRVDDVILRDYLDIPREGKTFTIDGRNTSGDYVIIEPAEDDEVVVKDVRVTFRTDYEDE